ncbi:MAG: hypothetical protein RSB55_01140 [Oscillospiraceae bacterium]
MEHDRCAERQILMLVALALTVPAVALPGRLAETAGGIGWAAPLLALPGALLLAFLLGELGDLPGALQKAWGKRAGRGALAVYLAWYLGLAALYAKGCMGRLGATGTSKVAAAAVAAAVTAVAIWQARGKLCAFCRGGELFFFVMMAAVGGVLLLSVPHIRLGYLARSADWGGLGKALGATLSVVSLGTLGGFLAGRVTPREGDRKRRMGYAAGICLGAALLAAAVIGRLGPTLTGELPAPFFTMVQALGVKGAFQRVEGPLAALWLLGDLALVGLLAFGGKAIASALLGDRAGKLAAWGLPAVGWILGAGMTDELAIFLREGTGAVNLTLGFLVPLGTWLKLRQKGRAGG